jgi:GNAT superfamily N-acetyltransferase
MPHASSRMDDRRTNAIATAAETRLRRARIDDVAALAWVRSASWRAAYRGIIPERTLARTAELDLSRMRRAVSDRRFGQSVWVAHDPDGTIFGYTWSGPQVDRTCAPFLGEIYELYLHPAWQRRGIGRRLLVHTVWDLVGRGLNPAMLWVLAENTARDFYAACGAVALGQRRVDVGGRVTSKLGYGWPDALPLPDLPALRGAPARPR